MDGVDTSLDPGGTFGVCRLYAGMAWHYRKAGSRRQSSDLHFGYIYAGTADNREDRRKGLIVYLFILLRFGVEKEGIHGLFIYFFRLGMPRPCWRSEAWVFVNLGKGTTIWCYQGGVAFSHYMKIALYMVLLYGGVSMDKNQRIILAFVPEFSQATYVGLFQSFRWSPDSRTSSRFCDSFHSFNPFIFR